FAGGGRSRAGGESDGGAHRGGSRRGAALLLSSAAEGQSGYRRRENAARRFFPRRRRRRGDLRRRETCEGKRINEWPGGSRVAGQGVGQKPRMDLARLGIHREPVSAFCALGSAERILQRLNPALAAARAGGDDAPAGK